MRPVFSYKDRFPVSDSNCLIIKADYSDFVMQDFYLLHKFTCLLNPFRDEYSRNKKT